MPDPFADDEVPYADPVDPADDDSAVDLRPFFGDAFFGPDDPLADIE